MAAIRSTNTKPEMVVRRLTHGMGYRYRLHGTARCRGGRTCFRVKAQGDIRPRLLLASAPLPAGRADAEDQPRLLAAQTAPQRGARRAES